MWMALIFYLSSLTQDEVPAATWLGAWQSYLGHVFLYGILSTLFQVSLWAWNSHCRFRWAVAASLYGVSDELHQSFVAGRSSTINDALLDSFAAIAAAACLWLIASHWRRNPEAET